MTTIEIDAPPTALSIQMQGYAQGYIDARKRAGDAWLSMGMFLTEARQAAKHGEWGLFLQATNTSEDAAKRLIAVYAQSQQSRAFAEAMRTNFLTVTTGYELISAPLDVQDRLLSGDTPPTQRQIRDEKREAANPAAPPTLDPQPPAAPDLADILLRLDAHGYTKTTTRQKGIATLYSFRDYSGRSDDTGGEIELAEGELPIWLAELDSHAAYAQAKQESYFAAQERATALGYHLKRDGTQFELTPAGQRVPALRGTLDQLIKTIEGYERNAAKKADDSAASDRATHMDKEARDKGRLFTARAYIASGDIAKARTALDAIEVSTWERDQLLATIPTDAPIANPPIASGWWNCGMPKRAMESAVNKSDRAGALHAALDLVRLFAGDDPKTRAAALLVAIEREMKGTTTDDQEGLSQAICNLNECDEGSEVRHWLNVGYALLDLEATE
jgi:hypothetical protein